VASYSECESAVHGKNGIPRSITQFLRDDINRLQQRLEPQPVAIGTPYGEYTKSPLGQLGPPDAINTTVEQRGAVLASPVLVHSPAYGRALECSSIRKISASMIPDRGSKTDIPRHLISLTSSRVLAASTTGAEGGGQRSARSDDDGPRLVSVKTLSVIPPNVIMTLIRVFIEKQHSLNPILHAQTLLAQVRRVLITMHEKKEVNVEPNYDFLIVQIVLAISVSLGSAISGHGPQRMAFSEILFWDGIKHLSDSEIFPSETAELQFVLLSLNYGTINPRCASVWMLAGTAMRICLKLGLHRETSMPTNASPLETDMRRRLFWMSYCVDRHVSAAVQYPISLSDATIDARHFSSLDDLSIEQGLSLTYATSAKEPALHWLEYRQIHSEMVAVHFKSRSIEDYGSLDDWIRKTEQRLWIWYDKHRAEYPWTETAYNNALTYLHRPSPLTPRPPPTSLLVAFENAYAVAASYGRDIQAGYFRRPWLAAHHSFASALIVLFCLRHGSKHILTKFDADQISEMTNLFALTLQAVSSEIWPEVSNCLELFTTLLDPLITAIRSGSDPALSFTAEQDALLAHLLYPGTTSFEVPVVDENMMSSNVLFNTDNLGDGFEPFDWDSTIFQGFEWNERYFDSVSGQFRNQDWAESFLVT
jgi:hypothetical protein